MRLFIPIAILFFLVAACDEPTHLDLRQTPPRMVIEGLLTNKPGYQYVKVSWSTDFYDSGKTPRIEDATVTVTDDQGNTYPYVHNPGNDPDSAGIYLPSTSFAGIVGRTYTLSVAVDGEVYTGTDQLLAVAPIDSLSFQINEGQKEDPKEPGKIYELLLFAREPQDVKNYYLFKYYRNDSLVHFFPTDVYFSDDAMLAEEINGVPSPVYYAVEDTARLEMYSLTRQGYVFYNDFSLLLNNDGGGMFGPVPAPPRSNLSGGALGFFQVSAITEKQAILTRD